MKLLVSISSILILNLFVCQTIKAQTDVTINSNYVESAFLLPPLEMIIDSVMNRHAMLRYTNKGIALKEENLKSERIYWTRNLGFESEAKYGTLSSLFSNDAINNNNIITNSKQFNYSVGVYVKFPLFDFLNRNKQIKIANLEIDEAKALAKVQEEQIRQMVITQYQDLILKQKLLSIKSQTLGDAKINKQMVEKEFRNGITSVSEYVRISDITSQIESDYEVAKSDFQLAKKLLEEISGFSFN